MLRHSLARHVHVLAQCRKRLAIVCMKLIEQAPPASVCQCFKYLVRVAVVNEGGHGW
jgi:hypothetical protein